MYAVVYTARFVSTLTDELYLVSFGYTAGNAVFVSSMYSIKDLITCIKTCKISTISINTSSSSLAVERNLFLTVERNLILNS